MLEGRKEINLPAILNFGSRECFNNGQSESAGGDGGGQVE